MPTTMPASASSTTTITTAATTTTTLRGGSGLFLLLLWIEGLCSIGSIQSTHAYIILPQQKPLSLSPSRAFAPKTGSASARCVGAGADRYFGEDPADNNNNNNSNSNSSNQDFSIEAAIGNAQHASEYERDAEFYRKRNEAYSKSLRTDDLVSLFSSTASSTSSSPADEVTESPSSSSSSSSSSSLSSADTHRHHHRHHQQQQSKASLLKASFDHIEASTYSLLTGRPLVALGIFCATGILVAYLSGFFFLEGYIENWNPAENDQVPYWEDAEIHTIQRVVE